MPYFAEARALPAEDALAVEAAPAPGARNGAIKVAVPVLSRIANFDDLDPLIAEPDVAVEFLQPGAALPGDADLVVLPGSKATIPDLAYLRGSLSDEPLETAAPPPFATARPVPPARRVDARLPARRDSTTGRRSTACDQPSTRRPDCHLRARASAR